MSDQAIVDQELAQQLVDRAKAEGVKLTGPGGLLGDLTKRVLEAGLEGEMDGHLGYAKHTVEGRDGGNSRWGYPLKRSTPDQALLQGRLTGGRSSDGGWPQPARPAGGCLLGRRCTIRSL